MNHPTIGLTLNYRDVPRSINCVVSMLADGAEKVWIWDNSEDGGQSAAALQKAFANDTRVVIYASPVNLGFAAGVNQALKKIKQQAPSGWILLINNDARLKPGGLQVLCNALLSHPEAKLVYPSFEQNGVVIGTRYYHRWFGLLTTYPMPGSFPYPTGCALLIPLDRIKLPFFDQDFFMYGEDTMLGWRLRAPGEMFFVPEVWIHHEGSASSQMGSQFYETRIVAGHWIMARKLSQNTLEYAIMWFGRLFTLTARTFIRALRFRSRKPISAFFEGWRIAHRYDPLRERSHHHLNRINETISFPPLEISTAFHTQDQSTGVRKFNI